MSLESDIRAEVASRQSVEQGAGAPRAERAEPARRKFDDAQSTPEALEQWDALLAGSTRGGKSRLGSLPSSDAALEGSFYYWKPKEPRGPEGGSRLFARNGEKWAEPNMSIGGG